MANERNLSADMLARAAYGYATYNEFDDAIRAGKEALEKFGEMNTIAQRVSRKEFAQLERDIKTWQGMAQ